MKYGAFNMIPKAKDSLQWKQATSPWPKKACVLKSQMTMLITFLYIKGIVHF
jgi:hypothetical protein